MSRSFYPLRDLPRELSGEAGRKGSALGRILQRDLPVPDGFIALAGAFEDGKLTAEAREELVQELNALTRGCSRFAVRSSGLVEDSAAASFAGAYETILNVPAGLVELADAMERVAASGSSERMREYCRAHALDENPSTAVVVQRMLACEYSGVLFTANPVSGSHEYMIGNFVAGQGSALLSGEADAQEFTISRPKGRYAGAKPLAHYAYELFALAKQVEDLLGCPQDIEWAVEDGNLLIVQSRPVTTLQTVNYDTYEINESMDGDFLWSSGNAGEALPDVMTPFTWSVLRELDLECQRLKGYYLWSGNICGRAYSNVSMPLSAADVFGGLKYSKALTAGLPGDIPTGMAVPRYPLGRFALLADLCTRGKQSTARIRRAQRYQDAYLAKTPVWYGEMQSLIAQADSPDVLARLWTAEVRPYLSQLWEIWLGGAVNPALARLHKRLVKLAGEEQSNLICSGFGGSMLASLGPLLGLAKIASGELTLEQYAAEYGHRSVHEFEVAYPCPADDPAVLRQELAEYQAAGVDVQALLNRQKERAALAQEQFCERRPHLKLWLERSLCEARQSAKERESLRNEFVKAFRVMRLLLLKAGTLCGIGEDIFLLYSFELPKLLGGNCEMLRFLPLRRATYERYCALPALPRVIRGQFVPADWLADENRSAVCFDSTTRATPMPEAGDLSGFVGSSGSAEGIVRVLHSFDEAAMFRKGEILVTATTNIGWTILFPKAAAIVTDIGAPLSHAAIVARELGIPAVVGCGNATSRLRTGDRVFVDGSAGLIKIRKEDTHEHL